MNLKEKKIKTLWYNVKYRTQNPNSDYLRLRPNMKMEEEWINNYLAFKIYVLLLPDFSMEKSLDRIDNDKGYIKGNLRWTDISTQNNNKSRYTTNSSGYTGVSWYERSQKFEAKIRHDGVLKHVGYYDDPKEAAEARNEYIKEHKLPNRIEKVK